MCNMKSVSLLVFVYASNADADADADADTRAVTLAPWTFVPARKKYKLKNSLSNRHLTTFDLLIIGHVICSTAKLLVDSGYREFN